MCPTVSDGSTEGAPLFWVKKKTAAGRASRRKPRSPFSSRSGSATALIYFRKSRKVHPIHRDLRIIFPNSSYQQALDLTNLTSLANRRIFLRKKLMADKRDESHLISFLAPQFTTRTIPYQLRTGSTTAPKIINEKDKESK